MRIHLASLTAFAVLGLTLSAHADTVTTYDFSGTLSSGGSVTGTVTFDLGAGGYSVTAEDITAAAVGGNIEFDATPTSSVANGLITVLDTVSGDTLDLIFADSPTLSLTACDEGNKCRVSGQSPYISSASLISGSSYHLETGSLTVAANGQVPLTPAPVGLAPEPSSMVLLGTGLLSAAGMVRRRVFRA